MQRLQSSALLGLAATFSDLLVDLLKSLKAAVRSRSSLVAENFFLRKQLAFYQEHEVKPRRLTDAARIGTIVKEGRATAAIMPNRFLSSTINRRSAGQ